MAEKLIPLTIPPGMYQNGTEYQTKGRWITGNLIRFVSGTVQPVGGWEARPLSGAEILGTPNAAIGFAITGQSGYIAVGTTVGLYVIDLANQVFDITPVGLTGDGLLQWTLAQFGNVLVAVAQNVAGIGVLSEAEPSSGVNVYTWASTPLEPAVVAWDNDVGPNRVTSVITTPERFLVMLGGGSPVNWADPATGYSGRKLSWPSQESTTDWAPTDINTAGDFELQTDGTLVTAAVSRGETILLTTTDAWTMRYIGGTLVYAFAQAGGNCGCVSPHAAVSLDTGVYWMSQGKFFVYDGFVRTIPCEVDDFVFNDINPNAVGTVWVLANPRFNEVTWFYCSVNSPDSLWPDKYVTYNYVENTWSTGALSRTSGITRTPGRAIQVPAMFGIDGTLFDHETGYARPGNTYAPFLESGPMEIADGDNVVQIQSLIPDLDSTADVEATLMLRMWPTADEVELGPYPLGARTSLRHTARQVRVRIVEAIATDWRVGVLRLGGVLAGRR